MDANAELPAARAAEALDSVLSKIQEARQAIMEMLDDNQNMHPTATNTPRQRPSC
jgi:hypothetical protein